MVVLRVSLVYKSIFLITDFQLAFARGLRRILFIKLTSLTVLYFSFKKLMGTFKTIPGRAIEGLEEEILLYFKILGHCLGFLRYFLDILQSVSPTLTLTF